MAIAGAAVAAEGLLGKHTVGTAFAAADPHVRVVTMDALRLVTAPDSACRYYVTDDGREGVFYYDSADTSSADDGAIVLVSSNGKRYKRELTDHLNPKWFGAAGDGTTDDTAAFNDAIKAGLITGIRYISVPTAVYKINGTILVPSNYHIDLHGAELRGAGVGVNNIFETAYVSSGTTLTSNVGIAGDHYQYRVVFTTIRGGSIRNCNKAFSLWNFNEACEISDFYLWDCRWAIHAERCFYGRFVNVSYRTSTESPLSYTNAAFFFSQFVNVQKLESLSVFLRELAFEFDGGADGNIVQNCTAESCTDGMKVTGGTNLLTIDTCYFENISGTAILLGSNAHKGLTIDNNWFHAVNVACSGSAVMNGFFGSGNRFSSGNCTVDFSDNTTNHVTVEVSQLYSMLASNQPPAVPANYLLGSKVNLRFVQYINDNTTGYALGKAEVNNGLIPFLYSGDSGSDLQSVPFCTVSKSAGSTFNVHIDTKIVYRYSTSMIAFNLTINDDIGSYRMFGIIFGDAAKELSGSVKNVTVSDNGGFTRISVSSFYHPTGGYSCVGAVRIV